MSDKRKSATVNVYDIGVLPPQAIELEEAVIGAIMLEKEAFAEVSDILHADSFYKESHSRIFAAAMRLSSANSPIDMLTITQELKKTGELDIVGGAYVITQLTNRVASAANIEFHARIIAQKFIQRELIRISSETIKKAYREDADCFNLLDDLEKGLTSINTNISSGGNSQSMAQLWPQLVARNDVLLKRVGPSGVPSGFTEIDTCTGGWQDSDLIIIAARPSMGKTALAVECAKNAAVIHNIPIGVFSMEMTSLQLAIRMVSSESNIGGGTFSRKGVPAEQMFQVESNCRKLIDGPLYIDDTPGLSLSMLRSKARKMVRQFGIKALYIDYLQLMGGSENDSRSNREQVISGISRGLKALAKELQIPIIALSQLSRANEQRGGDKRPHLSDLRESGAIEQDADIVIFLHRPEYYGQTDDGEGNSTAGIAEIIFSKHRNGPLGTVKLGFVAHLTKFKNLESEYDTSHVVDYTVPLTEQKNNFHPNTNFSGEDSPF